MDRRSRLKPVPTLAGYASDSRPGQAAGVNKVLGQEKLEAKKMPKNGVTAQAGEISLSSYNCTTKKPTKAS